MRAAEVGAAGARWRGRVVLEAIRPGLLKLAGRMIGDAADHEELWAVLSARCWEGIRSYPVERRPRWVAANLLLDTLNRPRTLRARRVRVVPCGLVSTPRTATHPRSIGRSDEGDVDGLLDRAVKAGALAEEEAEIILKSRIDGVLGRATLRARRASRTTR